MKLLYLSLLVLALIGCNNNDDNNNNCVPQEIAVTSLETEYGCTNTKFQLYNSVTVGNFIIIRNQQDFDQITDDINCRPQIDFATYDLILGKKQLTTGNETIQYQYMDDCDGKKLTVTFIQNETLFAPTLIYHALVPKLEANETIEVIQIIE
jgi:hypothetical protein